MLTKQQKKFITYQDINIYQQTYKLPILKNNCVKKLQRNIQERQQLIKQGVKYHYRFGGIIRRKKEITQAEILDEVKLFIQDYSHIIDFLNNYKNNYNDFLLSLTVGLKNLFKQKYLEIKKLEDERSKLEFKNHHHPQILAQLRVEKRENFKAVLLLSNAYFLTLEKISLISEGIRKLSEDTEHQKSIVEKVVKDLEVYQEVYEYQKKAQKVRQEIANIAQTAINLETSLQEYFRPFQFLIDELVKVDEYFCTIVNDIQNLGDKIFNYHSQLLNLENSQGFSEKFIDFMVTIYDKKNRLEDAFMKSQLLDINSDKFDWLENSVFLEQGIDLISNYISTQITDQQNLPGVITANLQSKEAFSSAKETGLMALVNHNVDLSQELISKQNVDYTVLRDLLIQQRWKDADIETEKLILKVIGKDYWYEVYQEDIDNFPCQDIQIMDQLWEKYSYGYFGFSVQQIIWEEMGGQVDYETAKRLGDRLGWRQGGKWLEYEDLTFQLTPITPMGHLPAKWLNYDQNLVKFTPELSTENRSMAAWRVQSWLVWQMQLFLNRVKNCQENSIYE
ncbi:MAG: hypothetical protein EAZ76_06730 [Nostocales cyanobacterium]|nr:MAG: hypothetical protein EAZ87_22235 [Nostocales cyanobacterium]TAF16813.1 MAG: hypothetical protein EAZ76_06730 [Nostocales cyanobacterium]